MNTLVEPSVMLARKMADISPKKLEQIEAIISRAGTEITAVLNFKVKAGNVFDAVQQISGFSMTDLFGPCRMRALCDARHMCAHFLVKRSGMSLAEVGRTLNRDHTTIINSIRVHERLMTSDRRYRQTYQQVIQLLEEATKGGEDESADA